MAKIHENKKGFKVIEVSAKECLDWGGLAICDHCNEHFTKGYYVAVLNRAFCEFCYNSWYSTATNYPEDRAIENKNFEHMKSHLGL